MTANATTHRIAFVADAVYPFNKGGKETRLYEITRHLAQAGHDVHVYTMKWWDGEPTVEIEGVWYHAICRGYPLYVGHRRSTKQAILFGLAVLRLLTERFDAIDVDHMPVFPLFSAKIVCTLRRKPLYATWHEVWGREYWQNYLGVAGVLGYLAEWLSFRVPRVIIANSDHTAERLSEVVGDAVVTTVSLGVDLAGIDDAAPSAVESDVIFAGRLLDHKNVDVLIRAIGRLRGDRPTLRCLIVGEGPERRRLEDLARECGVGANVTFMDFVPRNQDLFSLMKASKVFVLPSQREGFGAVVLEANACGLPVVAVRHPDNAAQRLIVEGESGLVVELDEAAVAVAIAWCLDVRAGLSPRSVIEKHSLAADWASVARRVGQILTGELEIRRAAA